MADTAGKDRRRQAGAKNRREEAPPEQGQEGAASGDRPDASAPHTGAAATFATSSISTADLNRNIGAVLDTVTAGGTVTLTRYGAPVAHIVPIGWTDTQALPTIATSPQLRPTQQVDPMRAQRGRDDILRRVNTSKRRG